jgi:hypothetical protein
VLILLSAAVLLSVVWSILVISRVAPAYLVQRRDICRSRIALPAGRYLRNGYAQTRLTKTMSMDWELVKVGKAINELMEVEQVIEEMMEQGPSRASSASRNGSTIAHQNQFCLARLGMTQRYCSAPPEETRLR